MSLLLSCLPSELRPPPPPPAFPELCPPLPPQSCAFSGTLLGPTSFNRLSIVRISNNTFDLQRTMDRLIMGSHLSDLDINYNGMCVRLKWGRGAGCTFDLQRTMDRLIMGSHLSDLGINYNGMCMHSGGACQGGLFCSSAWDQWLRAACFTIPTYLHPHKCLRARLHSHTSGR